MTPYGVGCTFEDSALQGCNFFDSQDINRESMEEDKGTEGREYGQLGGHRRPSSHLHLSEIIYSKWAKNAHFELSQNHKSRRQISEWLSYVLA
uniref:Uncharacterized protein n=1 Tax=Elaeophora elaphi TaxID=1147741 RepID=A0A0R3S474_9BILA